MIKTDLRQQVIQKVHDSITQTNITEWKMFYLKTNCDVSLGKMANHSYLLLRAWLNYEGHSSAKGFLIKVRLHGRFLLRFKVLFSPFGRCERIDESQNVASYEMS